MYDKFCKALYFLFDKILLPLAFIGILIVLFAALPICLFAKVFNISLKESAISTAITWGVIFILKILAEAIDHGEKLARAKKDAKEGNIKNG